MTNTNTNTNKKNTNIPTEIIKGLWIGDYISSNDLNFLKKNNIKAVVNMTPDIPLPKIKINSLRVVVEDSLKTKDFNIMYEKLNEVVDFIFNNLQLKGNNILIHCVEGKQRSCVVVLGYLLKYHKKDFNTIHDAAKFIIKKRDIAFHFKENNLKKINDNINFLPSIKKYHNDLKKSHKFKLQK